MGVVSLPAGIAPTDYGNWMQTDAGKAYSQKIASYSQGGKYSVSHAPPADQMQAWKQQATKPPDMSAYAAQGGFQAYRPSQAQPVQQSAGTPYGQPSILVSRPDSEKSAAESAREAEQFRKATNLDYYDPQQREFAKRYFNDPNVLLNTDRDAQFGPKSPDAVYRAYQTGYRPSTAEQYYNQERPSYDRWFRTWTQGTPEPMPSNQVFPRAWNDAMAQYADAPRTRITQAQTFGGEGEGNLAYAQDRPPAFQTRVTGFGAQMAPADFTAQRDAFIQRLNDERGRLSSQAGVYGNNGRPNFYRPSRDFGALWRQAGDMVKDGWTNPLAGLFG